MDSQPSGNNKEIIFLETNELYFSIKASNDAVGLSEYNSIKVYAKDDVLQSEYNEKTFLKEYKNYELIIEGKTMKSVAQFVAAKLAPLYSVLSTSTHFVLKKYKDYGTVIDEEDKDERMLVTPWEMLYLRK